MRPISEIIIHCTATRPEWMADSSGWAKREEIRSWHLALGWNDIGYHDLIDRDGEIITGRPINITGAHCKGHNTGSIGVSLLGGHGSSENDDFEENFTAEQDVALRKYIEDKRMQYPAITKISGHNEYAAKACPGFRVADWIGETPIIRTPEAIHHPDQDEQSPGGLAALFAFILSLFGRKS